ncbi:acyltransferase [Pullulanibacillus camelliae]|uniref:Acyltransferase n=1 Tax=Pullulanibacillus camelliae TaxID=1707096 RepID=A0A8J2YG98_9BACL|nr:acyltransferase [Pullulanibacillus camelliae]GGE33577.1 acyltransferase [Pullulanibacillus camelliae]
MKKKHLYEIDLMRGLIMLGVLSVHSITVYISQLEDWTPSLLTLSMIHSSMHFTRMAFMFITGLVLFITYYRRDFNTLIFWKKRILLIAIPYFFWTIIYILFNAGFNGSFRSFLHVLGQSLISGSQGYLYYVLVTFQFYIIFPLLLYGLRKFEKWHRHIFAGSFIFQLLLMSFYKYMLPTLHTAEWPYLFRVWVANYGVFVLTYECWFITGGILACHYDLIRRFIERHFKLIVTTLVISVLVVWAHYFFDRLMLNDSDHRAKMVEQPLLVPYSFFVILFMLYLGIKWAGRRHKPNWQTFSRFVQLASNNSFGMFLIQPFPLFVLGLIVPVIPAPSWLFFISIPFAILFVYFSSMLIAYLFNKTPILSYCVGRKSKIFQRQLKSDHVLKNTQ